jgi:hypothetical protein
MVLNRNENNLSAFVVVETTKTNFRENYNPIQLLQNMQQLTKINSTVAFLAIVQRKLEDFEFDKDEEQPF